MSITLKKRLRSGTKRAFLQIHDAGSRLGVYVLPKHYYVPIPDLRELRLTRPSWARRSEMRGIETDIARQERRLHEMVLPFEPEYRDNPAYLAAVSGAFGPGFGYIEAQALHGFLRSAKPRRVIEIGSGVSTFCMIEATKRNAAEGAPCDITCVEPYPSNWLKNAPVNLVQKRVEAVDFALFETLEAGDFLFVDSTHTVRVGGDVMRIVLDILPRLAPGVFVHFHDIYLPFDFQRDADRSIFQWMETALLHAYLICNAKMTIVFCLSQLHYDRPETLAEVFPEYVPEEGVNGLRPDHDPEGGHFPSSIYLVSA